VTRAPDVKGTFVGPMGVQIVVGAKGRKTGASYVNAFMRQPVIDETVISA
jgi:hypothetical protein